MVHDILGNIHTWLVDCLSERMKRVDINGVSSTWLDVSSGVAQRSVLGPVFLLIYVNDILLIYVNDITCKISKFTDDKNG